jgi:hypothetical protein
MPEETVKPRDPRAYDAFRAFVEEFARESDRAAVVLGAARLDAQLYQLISKVLVPCSGSNDELLDGDAPLATFSAKINMAHRLGLIDASIARALHLCRRIRNSFAHEITSSSLDAHRDRVRELVNLYSSASEGFESFKKAFFGAATGCSSDFRCMLAIVSIRLDRAIHDASSIDPRHLISLVPPADQRNEAAKTGEPAEQ